MKRVVSLIFCIGLCLLIAGCSTIQSDNEQVQCSVNQIGNENLFIWLDIEKNGVLFDHTSSVVAGKDIMLHNACKDDKAGLVTWVFKGKAIKKSAPENYSMDYSISLKVPFYNNQSRQYGEIGSISSINIKLNQPICIYEDKDYKVKLEITTAMK